MPGKFLLPGKFAHLNDLSIRCFDCMVRRSFHSPSWYDFLSNVIHPEGHRDRMFYFDWVHFHVNVNIKKQSVIIRLYMIYFKSLTKYLIFRMLTAIKIAGDQKNSPTVIDLADHCPTCKDVQESFSKLKKLCLCSK